MNYQDVLAYLVLSFAYLSAVVPFVGSFFGVGHGSLYKDDWKCGAAIHVALIGFCVVVGSILWAASIVWGE